MNFSMKNVIVLIALEFLLVGLPVYYVNNGDGNWEAALKGVPLLGYFIAAFMLIVSMLFAAFIIKISFHLTKLSKPDLLMTAAWYLVLPIDIISEYAMFYRFSGLRIPDHLSKDGFVYFYFSTITFTTTGYGDISPTQASLPLAVAECVSGYFMLAALFGTISSFIAQSGLRRGC